MIHQPTGRRIKGVSDGEIAEGQLTRPSSTAAASSEYSLSPPRLGDYEEEETNNRSSSSIYSQQQYHHSNIVEDNNSSSSSDQQGRTGEVDGESSPSPPPLSLPLYGRNKAPDVFRPSWDDCWRDLFPRNNNLLGVMNGDGAAGPAGGPPTGGPAAPDCIGDGDGIGDGVFELVTMSRNCMSENALPPVADRSSLLSMPPNNNTGSNNWLSSASGGGCRPAGTNHCLSPGGFHSPNSTTFLSGKDGEEASETLRKLLECFAQEQQRHGVDAEALLQQLLTSCQLQDDDSQSESSPGAWRTSPTKMMSSNRDSYTSDTTGYVQPQMMANNNIRAGSSSSFWPDRSTDRSQPSLWAETNDTKKLSQVHQQVHQSQQAQQHQQAQPHQQLHQQPHQQPHHQQAQVHHQPHQQPQAHHHPAQLHQQPHQAHTTDYNRFERNRQHNQQPCVVTTTPSQTMMYPVVDSHHDLNKCCYTTNTNTSSQQKREESTALVRSPPTTRVGGYCDDRDRMAYVSWIPKKARAYNAADKRPMELDLKRRLREDMGLAGLIKVLLFPPKGVHCKLIFDTRGSAAQFMEQYGGENRSPETERWKEDLCRAFNIDMGDKFANTVVKIEWSQK